ncbi:hypothetical protein PNIG_a1502 [Pseudoalteromonas nigrifaciens]|uniref:DUF4156 domain-containing protein n=1 Tax=Pseudoalteromonas nigrifaciens TaxID=28109 RepID=A0AAC9UHG4_9GAMM|nr:hypothetical protein [Pseudoalteromonas nigrifaciens]ASM53652.1 hypothetical protein PNIG_a1502 [Pseudoalteromonas nigrifaciens]GEN40645.1 hypothetical protein PNI02_01110 [Pseudoalteromonas nigrifaciens]SUC52504.1 Uncharacterised protein [Pseudoalteromonas nigrifaciens]
MNGRITIAIISAAIAGCASQQAIGEIKETVLSEVTGCQFITNVTGTSGWGGLAATTGINNAKEQAKQQAIDLGGTHLVWHSINGGYAPSVSADAYKCKNK